MVAQLFAARTAREPLWSFERELALSPDGSAAEPAILSVKLPEAEGIYDLRIVIHRRALQNRLGWKQTVDERKLQFVVLAKERPRPANAAPLPAVADTLFEIDPASPPWWERLDERSDPGFASRSARQWRRGAVAAFAGFVDSAWPRRSRAERQLGSISAADRAGPASRTSSKWSIRPTRRRPWASALSSRMPRAT